MVAPEEEKVCDCVSLDRQGDSGELGLPGVSGEKVSQVLFSSKSRTSRCHGHQIDPVLHVCHLPPAKYARLQLFHRPLLLLFAVLYGV